MSKLHKMDDAPRILTILGLLVEGMAILVFAGANVFVRVMASIPRADLVSEGMTEDEALLFLNAMNILGVIFIIINILLVIMFIVNCVVFSRLIKGKYSEEQAKKVYIYQAIWGGISLSFNTITAVLYIISAVQTHSKRYATTPREGI